MQLPVDEEDEEFKRPRFVADNSNSKGKEWIATEESSEKERPEELACYIMIGFGVGLRGEEVPLVSLEGMLYFWEETGAEAEAQPYTMITLFGQFKEETGYRWHCLPLYENGEVESHSGLG
eukprot:scaffold28378_cov223-Skeletonema_marinoi.AAC.7